MDERYAGWTAEEVRAQLSAAADLENVFQLIDDCVGPFCRAAVNAGLTIDDLAVELGVTRALAQVCCDPEPAAGVRRLIDARQAEPESDRPAEPEPPGPAGWILGWVSSRSGAPGSEEGTVRVMFDHRHPSTSDVADVRAGGQNGRPRVYPDA